MFYVYQVLIDLGSERLADELVLTNRSMDDFGGKLLYGGANATGADIPRFSMCRQALFQAGQFVSSDIEVDCEIKRLAPDDLDFCNSYYNFAVLA